ncbi:MAG: DinB family protein [Labilithrix sp.]|nr:DinB family protein [Labilithrix sp.]
MPDETRGYLLRQLETAWMLTSYHLEGLTTDECLWRPAPRGLHVHPSVDGWRADWPDREGYDIGPASIAWLTWHIGFWWSMVHDHSFGKATLAREDILWPETADAVRAWLGRLHADWRAAVEALSDDDLRSTERARWPLQDRPFGDIVAWANIELMKNAAEIGYARFLHGVRSDGQRGHAAT